MQSSYFLGAYCGATVYSVAFSLEQSFLFYTIVLPFADTLNALGLTTLFRYVNTRGRYVLTLNDCTRALFQPMNLEFEASSLRCVCVEPGQGCPSSTRMSTTISPRLRLACADTSHTSWSIHLQRLVRLASNGLVNAWSFLQCMCCYKPHSSYALVTGHIDLKCFRL